MAWFLLLSCFIITLKKHKNYRKEIKKSRRGKQSALLHEGSTIRSRPKVIGDANTSAPVNIGTIFVSLMHSSANNDITYTPLLLTDPILLAIVNIDTIFVSSFHFQFQFQFFLQSFFGFYVVSGKNAKSQFWAF